MLRKPSRGLGSRPTGLFGTSGSPPGVVGTSVRGRVGPCEPESTQEKAETDGPESAERRRIHEGPGPGGVQRPLAGLADDADYDFKVVTGFYSMQAFGRGTDMYTGGGFLRAEGLFGRLLTCNSPRIYRLERVRLAAMPTG